MQSKMVLVQEKAANLVAQADDTHAEVIATGVVAQLSPHLQPGERMPDVALLLQLLGRALRGSKERVLVADAANELELSDDPAARTERDTHAETLQDDLVGVRATITSVYGPEAAKVVGFEGDTPSDPVLVASLGAEVASKLPQLAQMKPLVKGVKLDLAALGASLAPTAKKLAAANAVVLREKREAEQTLVKKQAELARHGLVFTAIASTTEGLARLAGQGELARRVRPSPSRPGLTDQEVRQSDDPLSAAIG